MLKPWYDRGGMADTTVNKPTNTAFCIKSVSLQNILQLNEALAIVTRSEGVCVSVHPTSLAGHLINWAAEASGLNHWVSG